MNEDRFEHLMRDAAHTYRKPPQPDLEAMWREIDAELANGETRPDLGDAPVTFGIAPFAAERAALSTHAATRRPSRITQRLAIAATLVIGIALGRASTFVATPATPSGQTAETIAASSEAQPYEVETSRYLGQTAALLIALPSEVKAGRADQAYVNRAGELLSRTRLLLDSPAANEPQMRNLLEDLELVLAQVVRLQNDTTSRSELDLISRALEQRDVIPRLRTAVADISAN